LATAQTTTPRHLEAELDAAHAQLQRYLRERKGPLWSDDEHDALVSNLDITIFGIVDRPAVTLGDLRLQAKALLTWYGSDETEPASLRPMLEALARLPLRLWDERLD
jgi:hypothetical protein